MTLSEPFYFLPLGGCGEIGMNLNVYHARGRFLVVDCGVCFEPGNQIYAADAAWLIERRACVEALVLTHAHEDHLGAVASLWPQLRCPIYTTAFTASVLIRKWSASSLDLPELRILASGTRFQAGPFSVEFIAMTHSLPEAQALLIHSSEVTVLHTGDWKFDPEPVIGKRSDLPRLEALAEESRLVVVGDSTNALQVQRAPSEASLEAGLSSLIVGAAGRVVVSCFASNIARLVTLLRIAVTTGRRPALLGRSMQVMAAAARESGYWPSELSLVDVAHVGYLPREEVLVICTGSQGEPRTALTQLANGWHRLLDLEAGDRVVFSSRVIPGNEAAVERVVNKLRQREIDVIQAHEADLPIHASGHPAEEDLRDLYRRTRPWLVIPVHGEARHMARHAEIAADCGVPHTLVGSNGDRFLITDPPLHETGFVAAGRIPVVR